MPVTLHLPQVENRWRPGRKPQQLGAIRRPIIGGSDGEAHHAHVRDVEHLPDQRTLAIPQPAGRCSLRVLPLAQSGSPMLWLCLIRFARHGSVFGGDHGRIAGIGLCRVGDSAPAGMIHSARSLSGPLRVRSSAPRVERSGVGEWHRPAGRRHHRRRGTTTSTVLHTARIHRRPGRDDGGLVRFDRIWPSVGP